MLPYNSSVTPVCSTMITGPKFTLGLRRSNPQIKASVVDIVVQTCKMQCLT